jgi:hypothetical protein
MRSTEFFLTSRLQWVVVFEPAGVAIGVLDCSVVFFPVRCQTRGLCLSLILRVRVVVAFQH